MRMSDCQICLLIMLQLCNISCQVLPSSGDSVPLTVCLELDGQIQKLELMGLGAGRRETDADAHIQFLTKQGKHKSPGKG